MLDDVAGILQQNPELVLSIEGHTSADGNYESNKKLSQQRAESVKVYLQSKGISTSRLKATGFGPDVPLNSGKTAAEKAAKPARLIYRLRLPPHVRYRGSFVRRADCHGNRAGVQLARQLRLLRWALSSRLLLRPSLTPGR